MKLYRGYKTQPVFLTEELEKEFRDLQSKFDEDDLPKDQIKRFKELREIAVGQFFTDNKKIARDFAEGNGFLVEIDIEDKMAFDHYAGEHSMAPGSKLQLSSNFVFYGQELAKNTKAWNIRIASLENERGEIKNSLPKLPLR
ncbi:MAG: hypothetical protein V1814_01880 [Candidatus Moraniibacteriota bacterium]